MIHEKWGGDDGYVYKRDARTAVMARAPKTNEVGAALEPAAEVAPADLVGWIAATDLLAADNAE